MTQPDIPSQPEPHPAHVTPLRSQAQLELFWRTMMGQLGFTTRQLWGVLLGEDGIPLRNMWKVDGLPQLSDESFVDAMMVTFRDLLASTYGGSIAVLMARPGTDHHTAEDIAWANRFEVAATDHGVRLRPLYLATDVDLRIISPDDLSASA